jgi:hypothetical protein
MVKPLYIARYQERETARPILNPKQANEVDVKDLAMSREYDSKRQAELHHLTIVVISH